MNKDVLDIIQTMGDFYDIEDFDVLSHKIESLMVQKGLYVDMCDIVATVMELKNLKRNIEVSQQKEDVKQCECVGFFEKIKNWMFMNLTPYGRFLNKALKFEEQGIIHTLKMDKKFWN